MDAAAKDVKCAAMIRSTWNLNMYTCLWCNKASYHMDIALGYFSKRRCDYCFMDCYCFDDEETMNRVCQHQPYRRSVFGLSD